MLYALIGDTCTEQVLTLSWHSLGTTVLSCNYVGYLYNLFCVFKIFKFIESPTQCEVWSGQWYIFCRRSIQIRRSMLTEFSYSITMQGLGSKLRSELYWTLFTGKFWTPLSLTAPSLCQSIFIFPATSNILVGATITVLKTWKWLWLLVYQSWWQVLWKGY